MKNIIFTIMFYWTLWFHREKLESAFREFNQQPEEEIKNPDWILNGLILKLHSEDEITRDERLILALLINEYGRMGIEVKGGLYIVEMSEKMYREYMAYSLRKYRIKKNGVK